MKAATHYPLDDSLKLNQFQVVGSHNSYHRLTPKSFRDFLDAYLKSPALTQSFEYNHPPLDEQFTAQGVRQIELDVFLDPDGRFATRKALPMAGLPAESGIPELSTPGLKVFHAQEIDFASSCPTFVSCLQTVKRWSNANAGHLPIMILVEAKDSQMPDPLQLGFAQAIAFDKAGLDQIDTEIRSVFGVDEVITPDQVRGSHDTLEQAVLSGGWPTLGESRGKVLFGLDNEAFSNEYADGHPSLKGRIMFSNSEPGQPEAAFVKRNFAKDQQAEISNLVRKGYVVRTRADADTNEARANDISTRDAAIAGGAQWVSSDFPAPDPAMGTDYKVTMPGGTPGRCNPLNAPPNCKSSDIENPAYLSSG